MRGRKRSVSKKIIGRRPSTAGGSKEEALVLAEDDCVKPHRKLPTLD